MGENQKSGFLVKEGELFKTWKKRLFVLKNEELYYSKDQGSGKLGVITVKLVGKIEPIEYKKKKNCFCIETPTRTYYMCASDEETRLAWIHVLSDERDRLQNKGKYALSEIKSASLAPGAKKMDVGLTDFTLLKVIGKGSFGKVLLVRKTDNNKVYALKVLRKKTILEKQELAHTITEKNVLQKLVHPFLVNLYWVFQTPGKICFVMDFINGGELFSHLQTTRKLPEPRVQFYASEILLGLEYLHNNGVLYRDLKPENLLLTDDGHICMTDFGIAKEGLVAEDDRTQTFCGTPEYLAPEILRGVPYGKGVDWWSLGTLIYEMLAGNPPFYSRNIQTMYKAILEESPFWPTWFSKEALSICQALLQRDPEKRLTDPRSIKHHAFFRSVDWEKTLAKEIASPDLRDFCRYVPPVKDKEDVSMISQEFLDLKVALTPEHDTAIPEAMQREFAPFTS